jgi:hypothetical protein
MLRLSHMAKTAIRCRAHNLNRLRSSSHLIEGDSIIRDLRANAHIVKAWQDGQDSKTSRRANVSVQAI